MDCNNEGSRLFKHLFAILTVALVLSGCGESLTDTQYLERARGYLDKGQLRESVIELKNALKANPDNVEARWLLGETYLDAGLGADAEKELRRAMDLGMAQADLAVPINKAMLLQGKFQEVLDYGVDSAGLDDVRLATLWALRGHAQLAVNGPDEAIKAYDSALGLNAQEPEALLGRAYLAMREQQPETARQYLDEALAADPEFAAAWSLSGDLARQAGDLQKAEADYGKAIELRELSRSDRVNRALVRILLQKYDAAKQDIRFVRNNYKQTAGADYAQGLIELQQDNPAEAQISFETALSVDGNYYPAMFFLGVTHYLQGHATQARSYLNEYTRKFPANVRAQQILAVLDMREGKHADARQRLARVLALYPDDPATLKLMATVSMKLGDSAEAIEYMRKVAEQEPDSADARLRLGLGLMLQGEPEGGGAELQKAIEIDSELKAAEFVLILNQLNQGKLEEALAAAQAFTSRQPESPMAWNLLGLIQVRNDQPDAAQESFERALANVPGEPGAANNLALLALKRGDTAEAVRLYESVLEHHPGHMATLVKLAKLKTQSGQQSEVKELLEKTLKANPQALEPRILLGDIYLKQGKPGKAVTLLVEVQEEFAGHPLYWANLGRVQKAAGDTKGAVYSFERLVDLLPRSALAYQLLSEAYEENGNQDKLDRSLDKALALEPDHYPTRVRKLKLLIEQDKLEEAARLLQALQTAHPDQPELLLQQARLAQAQGKPGAAVKAYQEALKRAPNPDLLGQLALAQWQAGQREASFKTMQDWLEDHPEDTMVRYNLANLYLAAGRHEEARQAFARVIEAYPTHPVALTNLALLTRETDPDKALAYARLAHTFSPDAPVVQDALAQILLDRGDTDEALGLLEQAVETAPNDVKIRYHWAVALTKNGEKNRAINELRNILKQESRLVNEQEVRDLLQTLTGGEG